MDFEALTIALSKGFMSQPKDEAMVKFLPYGHTCNDRESNPHSAIQKHQFEFGALNRSATTLKHLKKFV